VKGARTYRTYWPDLRLQVLVIISVLTLDAASKLLAHAVSPRPGMRWWVLEPVVFLERRQHLRTTEASDMSAYAQIAGLMILLGLLNGVLPRERMPRTWRAIGGAAAAFTAGFMGNTAEVVIFGSATDFIGIHWRGDEAFVNLADISMAASMAVLGLLLVRVAWWYAVRRGAGPPSQR